MGKLYSSEIYSLIKVVRFVLKTQFNNESKEELHRGWPDGIFTFGDRIDLENVERKLFRLARDGEIKRG